MMSPGCCCLCVEKRRAKGRWWSDVAIETPAGLGAAPARTVFLFPFTKPASSSLLLSCRRQPLAKRAPSASWRTTVLLSSPLCITRTTRTTRITSLHPATSEFQLQNDQYVHPLTLSTDSCQPTKLNRPNQQSRMTTNTQLCLCVNISNCAELVMSSMTSRPSKPNRATRRHR